MSIKHLPQVTPRSATYLLKSTIIQLGLEVIDGMENSGILAQKITKGLGESFGFSLDNLA